MRTMTSTRALAGVGAAAVAGAALLALAACGKDGGGGGADKAATADGAAAPAASAPATVSKGLMRPKPGSWKITTTIPGVARMPQMPAVTTGDNAEKVADHRWAQGQRPPEIKCSEQRTGREGDAVVTHSVCTMQGRTMTSEIRAEGDFDRRYTVTNTTTTEPAPTGMPNPMVLVITAERIGDC